MSTPSRLVVQIVAARLQDVAADGLLLPVDGDVCRLGGAAASAMRQALPAQERADEMQYVEDELARLRPLAHPQARAIEGVARWRAIIVSAAYPHNVGGVVYGPDDCAHRVRAAVPHAIALAVELGLASLAGALIGTTYRMSVEQAIRAFADGLVSAARLPIRFCWAIPEPGHAEQAAAACRLRGLVVFREAI